MIYDIFYVVFVAASNALCALMIIAIYADIQLLSYAIGIAVILLVNFLTPLSIFPLVKCGMWAMVLQFSCHHTLECVWNRRYPTYCFGCQLTPSCPFLSASKLQRRYHLHACGQRMAYLREGTEATSRNETYWLATVNLSTTDPVQIRHTFAFTLGCPSLAGLSDSIPSPSQYFTTQTGTKLMMILSHRWATHPSASGSIKMAYPSLEHVVLPSVRHATGHRTILMLHSSL